MKFHVIIYIKQFFTWWFGQLSTLFYLDRFKLFSTGKPKNTIYLSPQTVKLSSVVSGKTSEKTYDLSFEDLVNDKEFTTYLNAYFTGSTSIILSSDMVLEREVMLPETAQKEFRNIINLQLPNLLPMSKNDIYYDCALGLSGDETGKSTVYLAMVKKETISKILLVFEGLGVLIDEVYSSSTLCKGTKFRFLNLRNKNKVRTQKLENGLILGAISLFCFCGFLYWNNLNQRVDFLNLKMGEYSVKAREVGLLKDEIITHNRNEKLYYARLERIRLEKILEAITTSLPTDSWIFEFNHSGSKITISGQSKDTTIVLKNLDEHTFFTNVNNNSTSISTASGQAVERFMISFDFMQPDFFIQGDKDE